MPINITLELSDEDIQYFARVMKSVAKQNAKRPEAELIAGARDLIKRARKAKAPAYVQKRLEDIALLIDLLDDREWQVDPEDRRRLLTAVGYFAMPKDMISDKIPAIGFLDDALIADLVMRELKHDLQGYREFDKFRDSEAEVRGKKVDREDWLDAKRSQIYRRIRERRERMWDHMRNKSLTDPILQYKSDY